MRFLSLISVALLLNVFNCQAQICFSDNAINYSAHTGKNFMSAVGAGLINNDTIPDVAFVKSNQIVCKYGDGTGNFTTGLQLSFNDWVINVQITDMDNDGNEDLVFIERYNKLHILYNDGTGVFADSTYPAPMNFPYGGKLFIEDLDSDGFKDVIFPAYGLNYVFTYTRSSSRQYTVSTLNLPFNVGYAALGKLDGDTLFDLLFAEGINYMPYYGNGSGFTAGTPVAKTSQMETIDIADMNNDGISDVVYTMALSLSVDYYNLSGNITSTTTINTNTTIYYHYVSADAILIFDTNNDNYPEVILPSEYNYNLGVVNNIGGSLSFTQYVATMGCIAACLTDYNMDGFEDIITCSGNVADYYSVFRNESGGLFKGDVYLNANFHHVLLGPTLVAGDVNNDGFADLLTHSVDSLNIILNDGAGHFSNSVSFYSPGILNMGGSPLAIADFNNDQNNDVVMTNNASLLVLMTGDGNGNFQPPVAIGSPLVAHPHVVISGHFNNDPFMDLAMGGNSNISVLLNNGSGAFTVSGTIPVGGYSYGITANDFNGDNVDDIAFVSSQTGGALYINNGSGVFTMGQGYTSCISGDLSGIASGDLNQDGNMDIVITDYDCQYPHRVLIFHGNGSGQLTSAGSVPVYDSPYNVTIADINFDGKQDIVTNSITGLITVALNTSFNYSTYYLASGETAQNVIAADFNNDDKPDLAYNNSNSVDIGVSLNSIIKIYPSSQISACIGDSVLLYITDTVPGFEWSNGSTNDSIYVSNTGVYSVSVMNPGFGNCFASTWSNVTFSVAVPVTFNGSNNPGTTCINQPVNLQAVPSGGVFSGPGVTGTVFNPAGLIPNQGYTISYDYTNANGCVTHADHDIFVNACVGIAELPELEIKITPNPVNDVMIIDQEKYDGYSSFEMYTPYGELVLQKPMNNKSETLNVSFLASGIYYLKFIDDSKDYRNITKRICVVHY